jgi:hypothetical protein
MGIYYLLKNVFPVPIFQINDRKVNDIFNLLNRKSEDKYISTYFFHNFCLINLTFFHSLKFYPLLPSIIYILFISIPHFIFIFALILLVSPAQALWLIINFFVKQLALRLF